MRYSFDVFKKEHLRSAWLSGSYTDAQIKQKYFSEYLAFCKTHGLEADEKSSFET